VGIGVTAVAMYIVAKALPAAAGVIGLFGQNMSKRVDDFCFSRQLLLLFSFGYVGYFELCSRASVE
jgi:hypothetical protein